MYWYVNACLSGATPRKSLILWSFCCFFFLTTQRMFELISATECLKIQNKADAQNSWRTWVLDQHSSHGSSHTHASKVKCVCDTAGYTTMTNFLGVTGDKTDSLQTQVPNSSETRCFRQLLPTCPTSPQLEAES